MPNETVADISSSPSFQFFSFSSSSCCSAIGSYARCATRSVSHRRNGPHMQCTTQCRVYRSRREIKVTLIEYDQLVHLMFISVCHLCQWIENCTNLKYPLEFNQLRIRYKVYIKSFIEMVYESRTNWFHTIRKPNICDCGVAPSSSMRAIPDSSHILLWCLCSTFYHTTSSAAGGMR